MIPMHLKLRNFLSYRDEAELDFNSLSIACLSGDNGSGKSAILDAITWAVWGKTRASNDRDVVSVGELEMDVTFVFQLAQREYRIFRRRSFTGRASQTIELDVREIGGSDWLSIAGDTVRETEQKIVALLNMEYDTFVNSAFILQGRADSFTQKPPSERKKILGDILNLQEYDELVRIARDELRAVQDRLSATQGRIATLDDQLERRPDLTTELQTVSAQLTDASEKHDLAQQLSETLKQQLAIYERGRTALTAATVRAERETRTVATLQSQFAARESEKASLITLIAGAAEIEHGVAEYERWRAENARLTTALRQVQQQIAAQTEAERAITQELAALQRLRDRHEHGLNTARQRLLELERDSQRLTLLREEALSTANAATDLAALRVVMSELRDERASRMTENQQLLDRMNEIKAHLATLEAGEAECPVCRRPLSPDDRDHVRDSWTTDGTALGERHRDNQRRCKAIDSDLKTHAVDEQRLAAIVQENATRGGTIQQLEARLADGDAARLQIESAIAEMAVLDRTIAAEDFAHEARVQRSAASAARTELDYDESNHSAAADAEARFAPFVERRQELELARSRLLNVEERLAGLAEQMEERQRAADEASTEVEQLRQTLSLDEDLEERVANAADEVDRLGAVRTTLWSRQGGIERQLAELDRVELERSERRKEATALGLDAGALKELVEAFGRNGIQALIIESILPELEDKANELLQRMSSSNLRVAFRSQREALSSDRVIETLDIIIRDEYGERPYALYSGGEAFRVNFAVRVALSKLLARRAGANVDMLVIDEGFGTQDSRGRDGLIEALRSVEVDFKKILVITHIGEIRELFPTRIDIVKGDRGSRITVT